MPYFSSFLSFRNCSLFRFKKKKKNCVEMQSQQIYQFFAVSSITNAQEKKSKLDPVPILVNYFSGNPAGFFFSSLQETIAV